MPKIMSARPLKRLRPLSPFQTVRKHTFTSQWHEILRVWSKLDNLPPLINAGGQTCSRFIVNANTAHETVVTMTKMKSMGLHSHIFSIELNGVLAPVILKKHTTSDENNVPPEIEAELQKWAHKRGLAPEVKSYNKKAMIIEKCPNALQIQPLDQGYEYMRGLSRKRFKVNTLNTALGKGSLQLFDFILKMYDTAGMYNRDPNFDNYMYLRDTLVQIDYGQNRFVSEKAFSSWFLQLPEALRRHRQELMTKLVVNDSAFPPLFQWYDVHVGTELADKKTWTREQWVTSILGFKQLRQLLLHQLEQERQKLLAPAEGIQSHLVF